MAGDPSLFTAQSIASLGFFTLLVGIAYVLQARLPNGTSSRVRFLFWWHALDPLVHLTIEAAYLVTTFTVHTPSRFGREKVSAFPKLLAADPPRAPFTPVGVHFLDRPDRLYGAFYGDSLGSRLWQEYARADKRWGGADLGIVSLELLTVLVMAPLALLACVYIWKAVAADVSDGKAARPTAPGNVAYTKACYLMIVVATGELYGGFMTFAPEWLSGSPNLDTSNWMYLWLYLVFMNTLWVFIPIWVLYDTLQSLLSGAAGQWPARLEGKAAKGGKAQ